MENIGGNVKNINDSSVHVGEHQYQGKFHDELIVKMLIYAIIKNSIWIHLH